MNKVLFLRRGYGISQEEIAKKLKTSRKSVREKENGKKDWNKTVKIVRIQPSKEYNPKHTIDEIFFK